MLTSSSPQTRMSDPALTVASLPHISWPIEANRIPAFWAAAFLVCVPVFFEAPLVRQYPWISLAISMVWLASGLFMLRHNRFQLWGDLAIGFTWTWLAGSIYWGWFRWEPAVHIPIEAIGLPLVAILLLINRAKIGSYFYLGSLLGTAITDLYFYWADLIPYWRQLMAAPPSEVRPVLRAAFIQLQSPDAFGSAAILLGLLILVGTIPLLSSKSHWWAFSGAVLSTILVDALFLVSAAFA